MISFSQLPIFGTWMASIVEDFSDPDIEEFVAEYCNEIKSYTLYIFWPGTNWNKFPLPIKLY